MTEQTPPTAGQPGPAQPPSAGQPGYPQPPAGYPQQPGAYPPPSRRGNALAITGFVIAVVSLVLCFLPIINNFAFFLAIVGLVLGIIGLVRTRKGASHKGLAVSAIVISVLAGIGVLVSQAAYGSAIDSLSDDLSATTSEEQPAATTDDARDGDTASTEADAGTRENPYTFDQKVSNEDWTVKLGTPREAGDEVSAENPYNEAPAKGMEYWMVPVDATYTGDETGWPAMDVSVAFVGDDAKTYNDDCGVIADDLMDVDELYEGGKAEGNVCVAVPEGAQGEWTLTAGVFNDPVFFTTGK